MSTITLAERVRLWRTNPIFGELPRAALQQLAAQCIDAPMQAGQQIVAEGAPGDHCYLVARGRVEVRQRAVGGEVPLRRLGPAETFGEIAALGLSTVRTASVRALTDGRLLRVPARTLHAVLTNFPDTRRSLAAVAERALILSFLKRYSPFAAISPVQLRLFAGRLKRRFVDAGTPILLQGERGRTCFLLRRGRVAVEREGADGVARAITSLESGAIFGEGAVLGETSRTATVRAVEACELLSCDREALLDFMRDDPVVTQLLLDCLRAREAPRPAPDVTVQHETTPDGDTVAIVTPAAGGSPVRLSEVGRFVWDRLDGRRTLQDLTLEYYHATQAFAPQRLAAVLAELTAAQCIVGLPLQPALSTVMAQQTAPHRASWRGRWRHWMTGLIAWGAAHGGGPLLRRWLRHRWHVPAG